MEGDTSYGKSFLAVEGFHYDDNIWKKCDYYWYDIAHYSFKRVKAKDNDGKSYLTVDGTALTSQEGVICEGNHRSKNAKYGSWISLALPEVNGDAIRLRFKEAAQLYTEPTVLAILQDAPYYGDLQDAKHYLVLGGTELGTSRSDSSAKGFTVGCEAGFYMEGSVGFLAHAKFEGELVGTFSYEHQTRETQEFAITFESHAGEGNKVVLYAIPITYYHYQAFDPQSKTWKDIVISQPGKAVHALLSAERYDEIVKQVRARWNREHPGKAMPYNLPLVSEVLTSKSGEPGTYTSDALGNKKATTAYRSNDVMNVNNSQGGTIGQDISIEQEGETSYEIGGAVNGRLGWDAKFLGNGGGAGIVAGFDAAYTHFSSTGVGTRYGGTVDNLPKDAKGYNFDWELVAKVLPDKLTDKKLDTSGYVRYLNDDGTPQGIWLVGFEVTNMQQPKLAMVHNVAVKEVGEEAGDTADTSSATVTLTWDEVPVTDTTKAQMKNLHYVVSFASNLNTLAVVPYGTNTATVKGLNFANEYDLIVRLANLEDDDWTVIDDQASIASAQVRAKTLERGEVFTVDGMHPAQKAITLNDDGSYKVLDDGVENKDENTRLAFTVMASYGKNGTPVAGRTPTFNWEYHVVDRSDPDPKKWTTGWKTIGSSAAGNNYPDVVWKDSLSQETSDGDGTRTATLRIDPSKLTSSANGTWFRCRVSYLDYDYYSSESQLIVNPSTAEETARARFTTTYTGARMMPLRASHKVATNAFTLVSDVTPDEPVTPDNPTAPEASAGTTNSPTTATKQAGTKAASTAKAEAIPQTGDATPRGGLAGLLAAAGAALVGLARRRRNQSEED